LNYLGIETPHELFEELEYNPEDFNLNDAQLEKLKKRARRIRIKRLFSF
jgi:hypothetical protein